LYRLCPASEPLTESCFMKMPLHFNRSRQQLRWNNGTRLSIPGTWVDNGTNPIGSTWAKNPIPRIDWGRRRRLSSAGVSPSAPRCNGSGPLSFPISNTACHGLSASTAQTAAACEAECCASSSCLTWVFNPSATTKCWSGAIPCEGRRSGGVGGWNGSSKVAVNSPLPPRPDTPSGPWHGSCRGPRGENCVNFKPPW
jgi:hypothetical protein